MKWTRRAIPVPAAALALILTGCGGNGLPDTSNLSGLPTLGQLEAMIQASPSPDSDGDFIPDDIEQLTLGTDHLDRDTDHDGLPDNYEIFGEGIFDPDAYVPDRDGDGIVAPRDKDDDGDFVNDGLSIDTDGDGIANYLEFYGYRYDWLTGRFVSCEDVSCLGGPVYRSDPLQRSTDQDPYPDDMEASGLQMDVSCDDPGRHPLVPAYPNLVVEFIGYSVELNEEITFTEGGSMTRGTEWSRQATRSHSFTAEASWEAGVTVGGEIGKDPKFVGSVSTSIGLKLGVTHSTEYSVSTTSSLTQERNWEEARTINPTDVAHIKLLLRVHNRGTAAASRIVPTLTLRVAGLNVRTFEPGNTGIAMLVPGASYPDEDGVYWVVDSTATGEPISLTMTELRAFEKGAPIGVAVTQLEADVMQLRHDGVWESAGSMNEFAARCDAVCAKLRIDPGDGALLDRMVYCQSGPSGPVVTLGDALVWTAGMVDEPDGSKIFYTDRDGLRVKRALKDWTIVFDPETLRANGYDPDDLAGSIPEELDVTRMVLQPESIVIAKAPRTVEEPKPVIHFATIDQEDRVARVCATDYRGVDEVVVHAGLDTGETDAGGAPVLDEHIWVMVEEPPGSNMYVHRFDEDDWEDVIGVILQKRLDYFDEGLDLLQAEAMSLDGEQSEKPFGTILPNPRPVAPVIESVSVDTANRSIYVQVKPNSSYPRLWSDTYPVQWVRAYHPLFLKSHNPTTTEKHDGYLTLEPADAYKDPYGWEFKGYPNVSATEITIVAYVAPGVATEREVNAADVAEAYRKGNVTLNAQYFLGEILATPIDDLIWDFQGFKPDTGQTVDAHHKYVLTLFVSPRWGGSSLAQASGWGDFYVRRDTGTTDEFRAFFNVPYLKLPPGTDYDAITKTIAELQVPDIGTLAAPVSPNWSVGFPEEMEEGSVFLIRTAAGRYAKLVVDELPKPSVNVPIVQFPYKIFAYRTRDSVNIRYLVWE